MKIENDTRTSISVSELKGNEKAEEIARLFSGDTITATALKTAKDLIDIISNTISRQFPF